MRGEQRGYESNTSFNERCDSEAEPASDMRAEQASKKVTRALCLCDFCYGLICRCATKCLESAQAECLCY